jgi:hypothetical protein
MGPLLDDVPGQAFRPKLGIAEDNRASPAEA